MHEKKSFARRADEFLNGKGFYIVLFVCIAVIGVSAWLLIFSQYSPLAPGDEGDYLDVMGPTAGLKPDADGGNDSDADSAGPEHTVPGGQQTQEPDRDALTVTPKPKSEQKPEANTSKPNEVTTPKADEPKDNDKADTKSDGKTDTSSGGKAEVKPSDLSFIWPVSGDITAPHSPAALVYDRTMGDWRTHDGIDIAVKLGTKVLSACAGTVEDVYNDDAYGTTVTIDHGAGVKTVYSNLAGTPTVKKGDTVAMGAVIGAVGSTALYEAGETAHLHLSMTVNGEKADPTEYLPRK